LNDCGASARTHGSPRALRGARTRDHGGNFFNRSHGNFANNVAVGRVNGLNYFVHARNVGDYFVKDMRVLKCV
jgi:hypothetical protein